MTGTGKLVIWKYDITGVSQPFELDLPLNSSVVDAGHQPDGGHLWVLLDPGISATTRRRFMVVATGEQFDSELWRYSRTFHMVDGLLGAALVWHLLESREAKIR